MDDTDKVTSIDEAREANTNSSTRPSAVFSGSGGLQVAIWKHKSENSRFDNYSVKLERNFKDKEGGDDAFKSTPYMRDSDLLRAGLLLQEADQWIEQDKGRRRSSSAERA